MLKIERTNITLVRGDTGVINAVITVDGVSYVLRDTDNCVFSVKTDYDNKEYALQKTAVNGKFQLTHADTKDLEAGGYVWDMQLTTGAGDVVTVGPGKLKLLADVTRE